MCNTAIRTPEGARAIIEENLQILYHLPKKYENLNIMLRDVKHDLYDILNHIKDIEPIIWQQKYVWFLDNGTLTSKVRNRTTAATSSRHFNFLCCLGVLQKLKQTREQMIGINMEFLLETGRERPINVFSVYRYTSKQLEKMEERAAAMHKAKITPGNISRDKLVASGLEELAKEVFYANTDKALQKKEFVWKRVLREIDGQCEQYGFTTKSEVCAACGFSIDKLDELIKVFRMQFDKRYSYKPPTKEQRQQLHIAAECKKWIITRKDLG